MRAINARAKKTMDILTELCTHIGDRNKFHTDPYLDVVVENIGKCDLGTMYLVAHYYKQHSVPIRDPEMRFIKGSDGEYYPYYYRQDGLGKAREAITWDEKGNVQGIQKNEQSNQAVFAGTWMRNIKSQQERIKWTIT